MLVRQNTRHGRVAGGSMGTRQRDKGDRGCSQFVFVDHPWRHERDGDAIRTVDYRHRSGSVLASPETRTPHESLQPHSAAIEHPATTKAPKKLRRDPSSQLNAAALARADDAARVFATCSQIHRCARCQALWLGRSREMGAH